MSVYTQFARYILLHPELTSGMAALGVRIVPVEDSETRWPAGRSVREVVLCGVVSSPGMRTVRSVAQVVGAAGYRSEEVVKCSAPGRVDASGHPRRRIR